MKKKTRKTDENQLPSEETQLAAPELSPAEGNRTGGGEKTSQLEAEEVEGGETPFSPEEELSSLQSELNDIRSKAEEYLDGWQRAQAEFANYKKRVQRERESDQNRIAGDLLVKYLGVVDDLGRALKDRPSDGDVSVWADGIDLIYRKLKGILEAEGVEEIPAEGEIFDPNIHEAITYEETGDHQEGEILEVIQPGYKIGDRVIRPALVRVAKQERN